MKKVNLDVLKEKDYYSNEAYHTLRTNIEFCGKDIKVIAFTSCTPDEGKSTVSLNLATSLAEAGKKVLFIDADLRRSVIDRKYQVGKVDKGLTHYLSGQASETEIIYSTTISHLSMIFAGPYTPDPTALLRDELFSITIQKLREEYDYIVLDTPPVGSVIDAAIVATVCDGIVLVIETNQISVKMARKIVEQLNKTNCRILGTVLNKVNMKDQEYYGTYYDSRYELD